MKALAIILAYLLATSTAVHAQVFNGDFETWAAGKPVGWTPVDTMGTYSRGIDSLNNSACFTYSDKKSGPGSYSTTFLSNVTKDQPYGAQIPSGKRVLTVHYTHTSESVEGYITLSVRLRNDGGVTYYAGGQILPPGPWRAYQIVLPESKYPLVSDFAEIDFKFSFASISKFAAYQYSISIDDITLDSILDATVFPSKTDREDPRQCYPNPASTITRLKPGAKPEANVRAVLVDVMGREVMPASKIVAEPSGDILIDVSLLPNGTYFLREFSGNAFVVRSLCVRH